ncbi:helix-turn-helix domain-containing protein [Chryseolinea lacunae]|uniref:Helix-turn-helix transcriptional regulator n=1 Tax=Chryseolinea lacunae TaxID=2801331 RepID=A0ABS1KM67_9BACT|nr:response regulator transcription factor [Chryseolinea lacunae]MBL0740435.1 helix-turn-helix transcriptional regulator [Chryseolinea lacunae]
MKHFKSISELHRENGFQPPSNPLIGLIKCGQLRTCSLSNAEFTSDFYAIGFKKLKSGVIRYGRTKYDHDHGSMSFFKPRQVIELRDVELHEDGFLIFFHEDILNGYPLYHEIKKYSYFDYETNEALHLSAKEEQIIWELYNKIETEYNNNPDEYSRDIILTHIDSILKYSQRFYKRQFINRTDLSGKIVSRFNDMLTHYVEDGHLKTIGLPTVKYVAAELNISGRYLSDLLKQETGKTALELIHIFLMTEAKNMLLASDNTVSEIAYNLGFENPPYFSRLFKKEVGISPNLFKKQVLN